AREMAGQGEGSHRRMCNRRAVVRRGDWRRPSTNGYWMPSCVLALPTSVMQASSWPAASSCLALEIETRAEERASGVKLRDVSEMVGEIVLPFDVVLFDCVP